MDEYQGQCGADMGGIWMPGPNGNRTYIPLRCNDGMEHDGVPHSYMDLKSGNVVYAADAPTQTVDAKGCVHPPEEEPF